MNQVEKDNVEFNHKHPFDRVHKCITRNKNLTNGAFRLFVIYQNAEIDSVIEQKNFNPTNKILAKIIKCNERTIRRYQSELIKFGYITIKRQPKTNDFIYTVHPIPIKIKHGTKMSYGTGDKTVLTI
jgi:hypothetical protein